MKPDISHSAEIRYGVIHPDDPATVEEDLNAASPV
jgi:hypothetical protein